MSRFRVETMGVTITLEEPWDLLWLLIRALRDPGSIQHAACFRGYHLGLA